MTIYKFKYSMQVIVLTLLGVSVIGIRYFYVNNNYLYTFLCLIAFCCFIYSSIGNLLSYTAITNDSLILKGPHKKNVIEFKEIRYIYLSNKRKSIMVPVSIQFSDGYNKIALTSLSKNYRELIQSAVAKSREFSFDCQIEREVDMLLKEWNK